MHQCKVTQLAVQLSQFAGSTTCQHALQRMLGISAVVSHLSAIQMLARLKRMETASAYALAAAVAAAAAAAACHHLVVMATTCSSKCSVAPAAAKGCAHWSPINKLAIRYVGLQDTPFFLELLLLLLLPC